MAEQAATDPAAWPDFALAGKVARGPMAIGLDGRLHGHVELSSAMTPSARSRVRVRAWSRGANERNGDASIVRSLAESALLDRSDRICRHAAAEYFVASLPLNECAATVAARSAAPGQPRGRTGLPGHGPGASVEEVSPQITLTGRLHVIAYRATLTCDVPARRMLTAATSRHCSPRTGSRCGSLRQNPARCTTSPPPASTPCPRFTQQPRRLRPVLGSNSAPPAGADHWRTVARCRRDRVVFPSATPWPEQDRARLANEIVAAARS
jgi:hypothetical protein